MAANYVLLERIELNADTSSVTFSNIPQSGYTDLKLVMSTRAADSANNWYATKIQFNTDTTAANYPYRVLYGFGTSAGVGTGNQYAGYIPSNARTANVYGNNEIYITNAFGSTAKPFSVYSVTEGSGTSYEIIGHWAGSWSGTAGINQIILSPDTGSWKQYSTFSLYGLAAVGTTPVIAPKASGGNITTDGTYWIHTFLTTGAFVPQTSLTCDYLVVAGGGPGCGSANGSGGGGGGGGAGGYRTSVGTSGGGGSAESPLTVSANTSYTITVGAGGAGINAKGSNGSNSVFSTVTAIGGGAAGGANVRSGNDGGSGGGAYYDGTRGLGTANQGYAGGTPSTSYFSSSGGGGAGSAAPSITSNSTQPGGNGVASSITGTSVTRAAGGTGGYYNGYSGNGTSGAANSGTGGNGVSYVNAGDPTQLGGSGGSGIVVIRYPIA